MGHRSQSTLCEHKENCRVMVWHVTRPRALRSARDSSKVYVTLLRECAVKFLATHSSNPPTHTKGLCKSPSGLYRWDVNVWFYRLRILSACGVWYLRGLAHQTLPSLSCIWTEIWQWGEQRAPWGSFPSFLCAFLLCYICGINQALQGDPFQLLQLLGNFTDSF